MGHCHKPCVCAAECCINWRQYAGIEFNFNFFSQCTRNTYLFSCCGNWRRSRTGDGRQQRVATAVCRRMSHQL